ncbi:helix-turn-helix domain-containing protein [Streptomyces sp. CMB-StM0423]|uniref:helix-turn-helix domain-containing protein n=1 Tax=Streptomyces sp. CMB-StM0423 TaxID=2059884 RepID=UPI000C6FD57F|nr:helix-turn-helix transcriptional regulator [Streptomyces sp. CMB-StM0423]AUH41208.1 XRE family transcriptional regulator [Streptomyces sp. CMB-StM0423]
MDGRGIGRRIAYWRERRRLTQADFGALMGQSRRWVQDLESGARQADPRLSVLESAAHVLQVRMDVLLADEPNAECIDAVELATIRVTLQRYDVLTGSPDPGLRPPLAPGELRRRVAHGWAAFQVGHFASLGRVVPELLIEANRAAAQLEGDDQRAAFRALSMTLQLIEAAGIKYGDTELAMTAAHRAVTAAERSENALIVGSAARRMSEAMTHHGQAPAAAAFAVAAADRLERTVPQRDDDGLSVLGMLYLKAAMAAAAAIANDTPTAVAATPELFDRAAEHADCLGRDDNRLWTAYGPTNVALHRVAAHVQLSEGADAIAVSETIPAAARDALPRERRAHFLTDLALAYGQAGRREKAVDTLLAAEREAAEEVTCRPRTKQLVENLRLLGVGNAEGRLISLAKRCGLPG